MGIIASGNRLLIYMGGNKMPDIYGWSKTQINS